LLNVSSFLKDELCIKYNVTAVPKLVLLNADSGEEYIIDACRKIQFENTSGSRFPWKNDLHKSFTCNLL
jgi:hypothetical protein